MTLTDEHAIRAIEYLVYEWARAVDEDRLEDLAKLLTDDAEYKVASRYNLDRGLPHALIHCKSAAQLRDRILSARVANVYERHHYRHLVTGVQVIGQTRDTFEVRANFSVIRTMEHDGSMAIFASGQYRDTILFVGELPRFQRREVVIDSRAIDTLLVFPL
jgi:anthranilate 1,2-dioxygenase small subunit